MSLTVGEVRAGMRFDLNNADKDLKDAEKKVSTWGDKLGKVGKATGTAIAGGIAAGVGAISALAMQSVNAYADIEQLQGGMEKIFDELDQTKILNDADEAYRSMNISAAQYMDMMAQVGATFSATMGDERAYITAKAGMQALADYASGTGKNVDLLMDKYKAITRSASGYLSIADQFAGLLPQTTDGFLEEAYAAGYLSEQYGKMSEIPIDEYQMAITSMLEDGVTRLNLTGNTVAETEDTISGSLAALKAQWKNTIGAFADPKADLGKHFEKLCYTASKAFDNLVKAILKAVEGIGRGIETILPKAIDNIPKILNDTLPKIVTLAVSLLGKIVDKVPDLVQAFITLLTQTINQLAPTIPTLVNKIVSAFMKIVTVLTKPENIRAMIDAFFTLVTSVIQALPQIITAITAALPQLIVNLVKFFVDPKNAAQIVAGFIQLFGAIIAIVPTLIGELGNQLVSGVRGAIDRLNNFLAGVPGGIVGKFKAIGSAVINGMISMLEGGINSLINGANKAIGALNKVPGVNIPKLGKVSIPRVYLAQGGVTTGATNAIIGEAGREAVIPLEHNTGNWAGLLASKLAEQFEQQHYAMAGANVTINNQINNQIDAAQMSRDLMELIRRA